MPSSLHMRDSNVLDGVHRSADGYLAAYARVARVGTQQYLGSEVGRPDLGKVTLYRPETEVFNKDALRSMAHRPVTLAHPPDMVDSKNWGKYAVGHSDGEVTRDGDCIRVPMVLMDQIAIDAVERDGVRELSVGYTTDINWTAGVTPTGEAYDGVQTNIRGNHHALVTTARGGPRLRFGDGFDPDEPRDPNGQWASGGGGEGHTEIGSNSASKSSNNPFTWYQHPLTAKQYQSNANHSTYERMGADEELAEYDRAKMKAPRDVIANAHTARWVEKEHIRLAQNARREEQASSSANSKMLRRDSADDQPDFTLTETIDAQRVNQGSTNMSATVLVDGVKLEVADQVAASVIEKYTTSLLAKLADAEKKAKKSDDDMDDEKKKACDAIDALKKEVSARDGQIAVLTQQIKDAEVTPQKLTALVADREAVLKAAAPMLPKTFAFDGKSDDDIRKAAVEAKLGDAAKGFDAAAIGGAFKALSLAKPSAGTDRLAHAIGDHARARDNGLNDNQSLADAAYNEMVASYAKRPDGAKTN